MVFNTGAALLDAIVLAIVDQEVEGTYGYRITQDVRAAIDVSESRRTIIHSYSSSTRYMEMWKVHGELLCGYMESYMDLDGQQVYPIW